MGSGIVTRLRYMLKRLYTPRSVLFQSPVSFNRKMHFCGAGSISIGEYTRNRGDVLIESVQKNSAIVIGQNTFFNQNCIIVCRKKLQLGMIVCLAQTSASMITTICSPRMAFIAMISWMAKSI